MLLLCAVLAGNATVAMTASATSPHQLASGTRLNSGQSLTSPDGFVTLVMQTDGNLVEYAGGKATWFTNTAGTASGGFAILQTDGNFVVYESDATTVAWSSGVVRPAGQTYTLHVQDDGDIVSYVNGGSATWASHSFANVLYPGAVLHSGQRFIRRLLA